MKESTILKQLAALAHEGRLKLFRRLVEAGPDGESCGDLAAHAGSGITTTSAQLQVLANVGLVSSRRRGRSVIYCAGYASITEMLEYLLQDCCGRRPDQFQTLCQYWQAAKRGTDDPV